MMSNAMPSKLSDGRTVCRFIVYLNDFSVDYTTDDEADAAAEADARTDLDNKQRYVAATDSDAGRWALENAKGRLDS